MFLLCITNSSHIGGSTYGPNRHRPPLLTDKSCKFSLFSVILGLFWGYISHPPPPFGSWPPFLHILDPPLSQTFMTFFFTGKTKCMAKSGDCVVKHAGTHATGLAMVVS